MKALYLTLAVVSSATLFTAIPANAQIESNSSDVTIGTLPPLESQRVKTIEPDLSGTSKRPVTERNIDIDLDSGAASHPDMNGAAGTLGSESSGGLNGGVSLSIDRR